MTELERLGGLLKEFQTTANNAFAEAMRPEIMESMNDEQKALLKRGKNAFNLDGLTPDEKLEELQKLMKDVANFNK